MNVDGSKWCVRQDFLWPPVTENFGKNLQRDGTDSPLGTSQEIARDPGSFYVVPCGLSVSGHQAACQAYRSHDKCPSEKKKEQMPTINNTYVLLGTRVFGHSWLQRSLANPMAFITSGTRKKTGHSGQIG